jgi:hypothetical protein
MAPKAFGIKKKFSCVGYASYLTSLGLYVGLRGFGNLLAKRFG